MREYNQDVDELQKLLDATGAMLTFKVASYLEQYEMHIPGIATAQENGISEDDYWESVFNMLRVRWFIRINGRKLIGITEVSRQMMADAAVDIERMVIGPSMRTIGAAITNPEDVHGGHLVCL